MGGAGDIPPKKNFDFRSSENDLDVIGEVK